MSATEVEWVDTVRYTVGDKTMRVELGSGKALLVIGGKIFHPETVNRTDALVALEILTGVLVQVMYPESTDDTPKPV